MHHTLSTARKCTHVACVLTFAIALASCGSSGEIAAPTQTSTVEPSKDATQPEAQAKPFDAEAFFQKIAPVAADLGPTFQFVFDPVGAEQDGGDREIQNGVPECNGIDLLMPYFVPVAKTKAAKGWLFVDPASPQQNTNVEIVLVMENAQTAQDLLDKVRATPNFVTCSSAWIASVNSINGAAAGPWAGKVVKYSSQQAALAPSVEGLGADQIVWTAKQDLTVDGKAFPQASLTSYTARFGSVILLYNGEEAVAKRLASRLQAAMN